MTFSVAATPMKYLIPGGDPQDKNRQPMAGEEVVLSNSDLCDPGWGTGSGRRVAGCYPHGTAAIRRVSDHVVTAIYFCGNSPIGRIVVEGKLLPIPVAIPGPQGIPGIPGRDGRDGTDGRDGQPGQTIIYTTYVIGGVPQCQYDGVYYGCYRTADGGGFQLNIGLGLSLFSWDGGQNFYQHSGGRLTPTSFPRYNNPRGGGNPTPRPVPTPTRPIQPTQPTQPTTCTGSLCNVNTAGASAQQAAPTEKAQTVKAQQKTVAPTKKAQKAATRANRSAGGMSRIASSASRAVSTGRSGGGGRH